jgi:glyoxylase-like metal-dependent hydrolase (beta-lactamase superfamily II)
MSSTRGLPIADHWFERRKVDDSITLLWEPFVDPLVRCNIWHVHGRDRDLVIDMGMGIASLRTELAQGLIDVLQRPVLAFITHGHFDHVGSWHEFEDRAAHPLEPTGDAGSLSGTKALLPNTYDPDFVKALADAGYPLGDCLVTAIPEASFDVEQFDMDFANPTQHVHQGDLIDLGDRSFEVLHLPGHSPGSVGLWDAATGTLFSGDAVYDGPLLDEVPGADIGEYVKTMERLRELPVEVVHGGHDPSFGRDRLYEIAESYLARRG